MSEVSQSRKPASEAPSHPGSRPALRPGGEDVLWAATMRILFVTSNRVGDAVLSTGLLDHLIRAHPDARITVVCGRVAEGVFARMPNRDRTIILDKRPYGLHWLPLWATTVRTVWDLVVDI